MKSMSSFTKTQRHALKFHGEGGKYFVIWLVNIFLSIITLGIYSAWAKVRTYRYFYGNTELSGDRFDYHARPLQILIGRIIAFIGIVIFYICSLASETLTMLIVAIFVLLLPWIIVRSWRFNAIMSSYRGVRFNYICRLGRAYWIFLGFPLVCFIGLILAFGVARFLASGLTEFILALVFFIPAFITFNGVSTALSYDLYVNNLFFGDAAFKGEMKKGAFVKMAFKSALIVVPVLLIAGAILGKMIYSIALMSAFGGAEEAASMMILSHYGSIILVYVLMLFGSMVAAAWLIVAHRNYVANQTTLNEGAIRLYSSMKFTSYLGLLFTNALIVIFSLGIASPFAHVRHARYVLETLEVEGDLDSLTVHAHSEHAPGAVTEELVQALDINVGF